MANAVDHLHEGQMLQRARRIDCPITPAPRPQLTVADVKWADELIQQDYNPVLSPIPHCADTDEEPESEGTEASEHNSVSNSTLSDDSCSPLLSSSLSPAALRKIGCLDDDAHRRKPLSPPFRPTNANFVHSQRMHLSQPHPYQSPQRQRSLRNPLPSQRSPSQLQAHHRPYSMVGGFPRPHHPVTSVPADPQPTNPGSPHNPLALVLSPPPEPTSYIDDLHIEPLSLPQAVQPPTSQPPRGGAGAKSQQQAGGYGCDPAACRDPGCKHNAFTQPVLITHYPANHGTSNGYPATIGSLLRAGGGPHLKPPGASSAAAKKRATGTNKRNGGVSKAQSSGKPRRFCHVCRSPKDLDKIVFCGSRKQSHVFCSGCVQRRLGLSFEELVKRKDWLCPKCEGHCPCSKCRKKYPPGQVAVAQTVTAHK